LTLQSLAQGVYAHNDPGGALRTSSQSCDGALKRAQAPARLNGSPVPHDVGNPAQQITFRHGRIGNGHSISTGQKLPTFEHADPGHNAVSEEATVAAEQHDVSF
jgi:hypothetical protein